MATKPKKVFIGDGVTWLELDVCIKETHKGTVDVTDHAVEQGIAISDHARTKPEEVTIKGMVTNTSTASSAAPYHLLGQAQTKPADAARQYMRGLKDHHTLVGLVFESRDYSDMVLTELNEERDSKTGDVFQFTATFKYIRKVTNKTTVVATKKPGAKKPVALGAQATPPMNGGPLLVANVRAGGSSPAPPGPWTVPPR